MSSSSRLIFEPGTIYCGDCLQVLQSFPDECVDLIYIDPPFHSGRSYEILWGDAQEKRAFDDRWGDVQRYLEYMRPRVVALRRVLKRTGSFYYHCDWHAGHYIKVMLDEVFGIENFQSDVIWYYRGGGVSKKRFARRHDYLFVYTKGKHWTFNYEDIRVPYSEESLERLKYKAKAFRGERVYDSYEPHPKGKHPDDVWIMQPIMPSAKERLGYPTQKPLRLLEQVIKASSNEGDIVLDAFCGCGTTLVAAEKLGRRWVGIDVSPTACRVMAERLECDCAMREYPITGTLEKGQRYYKRANMPMDEETVKKLPPFEFQNWAVIQLGKILHSPAEPTRNFVNDKGIDGKIYLVDNVSLIHKGDETLFGEKTPYIPVQVKQQAKVGRPEIDSFETALRRDKRTAGFFVGFDFTRGALNEIQRVRREGGLRIYPFRVRQLIAEDFLSELTVWRELGE